MVKKLDISLASKYIESFKRTLLLNKYFLYSNKVDYDSYNIFLVRSFLSFAHWFGDEGDIYSIIEKISDRLTSEDKDLKKILIIGEAYKYAEIAKKEKVIDKAIGLFDEYIQKNTNPIKQILCMKTLLATINILLYAEIQSERRANLDKVLIRIAKKKDTALNGIKNENMRKKFNDEMVDIIASTDNGKISDITGKEIYGFLDYYTSGQLDDLRKLFLETSLLERDILDKKNLDVYPSLDRRFLSLLKSFNYNSFSRDVYRYLLYISSNLNRIGGRFDTTDIDIEELKSFAKTLQEKDRNILMFQLGFLNPRNNKEFQDKLAENDSERGLILYGSICSEKGILPAGDEFFVTEGINYKSPTKEDYSRVLDKISTNYEKLEDWNDFINLFVKLSNSPVAQVPQMISCLIIIRAIKKQPTLLKGTINIEEIARKINLIMKNVTKDKEFVENFPWFIEVLSSSLPTNQNLVTEYRTTAWNWYKEIAEMYSKDNLSEYSGVEKEMIYYFHDSPGPFHIEIMKAYCNFLRRNDDYSHKSLSDKLAKLNITIRRDYVSQFGIGLEEVIYKSEKLLNAFQNLYGGADVKVILERLKNTNLGNKLESSLITILKKLTKYDLTRKEDITQKMINRSDAFEPEDYPSKEIREIIENLTNSYLIASESIKEIEKFEEKLSIISIQTSLKSILFKFITYVSNNLSEIEEDEAISLIKSCSAVTSKSCPKNMSFLFDYMVQDLDKYFPDDKKFHSVLKRAERAIQALSEYYTDIFQSKVNYIKSIKSDVAQDFTADIIRESLIFPFSELIKNLLIKISEKEDFDKYHITNVGEGIGNLIYLNEKDISNYDFKGNEILITEDMDTHSELPNLVGIISKTPHQPLSHIALRVRERNIPWYTPSNFEFEEIKKKAIREKKKEYILRASLGDCSLKENRTKKKIEKKIKKKKIDILYNIEDRGPVIREKDYELEKVGAKAYYLKILSSTLEGRIPKSVTIPFGFFVSLINKNKELKKQIEELQATQEYVEKRVLERKLRKIRELIMNLQIDEEDKKTIQQEINKNIDNPQKIIVRSTTNAEDLPGHAAAGVYDSKIVKSPDKLFYYILKVFTSFYTPKAWEDRRYAGFNEKTCFMSTLIQQLVEPKYSFVVHTSNPLSKDSDELVIELVNGLGEALVSGLPEFSGLTHQFVYNRKSGKLIRKSYATKVLKQTFTKKEIINPLEDVLQYEELPIKKVITSIFQDSIIIERTLSEFKYGRNAPQDIEGLITFEGTIYKDDKNVFRVHYVQARDQVINKTSAKQKKAKEKKIVNKSKEEIREKFKINNRLPIQAFELPKENFGNTKKTNLITLFADSFEEVMGRGRIIMSPIGSLDYLTTKKSCLWKNVKDIDFIFYDLLSKTKYEAFQNDKKYMEKVKNVFIQKAKKAGLIVYKDALQKFLFESVNETKRAQNKAEKVTFGQEFSPSSFLKAIKAEGITKKKELEQKIDNYLASKRISKDYKVFYSFKFSENSDYSNLVIASFIKAYLTNSKLIAPVFWDWKKTIKVLHEIFQEFDLLDKKMNESEFTVQIIKKVLEFNLIPQIEPFDINEVKKKYPEMDKYILEGWIQAIIYFIRAGGKIEKNDLIIRDHIDVGSIGSILCLLASLQNEQDKNSMLKLLEYADNLKIPSPSTEHLKSKFEGDLREAHMFLLAQKSMLKEVKEKEMNEKEAINFLRGENQAKEEIISLSMKMLKELAIKNIDSTKRFSANLFKQLKNEWQKYEQDKQSTKNKYHYSSKRLVGAINDSEGIKDLDMKYYLLDKNAKILIQYSEIKNSEGKLKGYRYYNVGVRPGSDANIIGLKEILSYVECIFKRENQKIERQTIWAGHSRPDLMITGPACNNYDNCSLIPPKMLTEFIELFIQYKKNNNLTYHALNYEKNLPSEFEKSLNEFLFNEQTLKQIGAMIDPVKEINPNLKIINDFDSLLIEYKEKENVRYVLIDNVSLKITSIKYFTEPLKIKDPWWDMIAKGLNSWSSYFGDELAIKNLNNLLSENPGGISSAFLMEKALIEIFDKRRISTTLSSLSSKEEAIRTVKETIRISIILGDEKIRSEAMALLKIAEKDYKPIEKKIVSLWIGLNNRGYKNVVKTISKNISSISKK